MKRMFLLLAVVAMFATTAFAQDYKNAIGLRLGYGTELQYEHHFSSENYLEANFGLSGFRGDRIFVNALYNWNLCEWDWTPNAGKWFLSAGVGGSLGMWAKHFQVGVAGNVAFGIRFNKPVTLSVDYRPTIYFLNNAWAHGFTGFALTCTYNF